MFDLPNSFEHPPFMNGPQLYVFYVTEIICFNKSKEEFIQGNRIIDFVLMQKVLVLKSP